MKFWGNLAVRSKETERSYRHDFVIGPLCNHRLLGEQTRIYYCQRCNWRFLVSGNNVVVVDEKGAPLAGPDSAARFDTFEDGPCPAVKSPRPIDAYLVHLKSPGERSRDRASGQPAVKPVRSRPLLRLIGR